MCEVSSPSLFHAMAKIQHSMQHDEVFSDEVCSGDTCLVTGVAKHGTPMALIS